MTMEYTSTRNQDLRVTSARAILTGLSLDGGLFVPVKLPKMDIKALQEKSYEDVAFAVLSAFLPDYDTDFLKNAINESYGKNFNCKAGQLNMVKNNLYSLELWHGPTAAFKDYALQLMPKLLVEARRMLGETDETVVLVATSGDTGSAALAGYSGLSGTKIAVFYPDNGTSALQRLQMTTQTAKNLAVYGVKGNFDDAQSAVKATFLNGLLAKQLAAKGKKLSSANSINWGRLVPQIVYYVTSYLHLCKTSGISFGTPVNFCVPTGNFGNIMAAWYAKQIGVPIGKLICASNKNNVLTDFIESGNYNSKRKFYKTSSPSMDILLSSNLERLLWHLGESDVLVRKLMKSLATTGEYQVEKPLLDKIKQSFGAACANEDDVFATIKNVFEKYNYLSDPHTAVGFDVLSTANKDNNCAVVVSTASPFKFAGQVLCALGQKVPKDEFDAIKALEHYSGQKSPTSLSKLMDKPERFTDVIDPEKIHEIPLIL